MSIKTTTLAQYKGRLLYACQRNNSGDEADALKGIASKSALSGRLYDSLAALWTLQNKYPIIWTTVPKDLPEQGHVFVVLGSGLKADGSMPAKFLRRLKLAKKALDLYPKKKLIISGGAPKKGKTEATVGYNWLRSQGIAASRLIREASSASTIGNAKYTMAILVKQGFTSYTIITDASHQRRASVLFEAARVLQCEKKGADIRVNQVKNISYPDSASARKAVTATVSSGIAYHTALLLGINTQYQAAKGSPNSYPTLKVGSRGAWVKALQYKLGVPADGIYGPKTESAVRRAQKSKKLIVDGIAGPRTLKALGVSA